MPPKELFYSIIIPLYNRPQEIKELLDSLCEQQYTNFEVLVIEDGSVQDAKSIVESFANRLDIHYYFKENTGQGFSRNYGFERAKGDYFIIFDSDILVPNDYLLNVSRGIHDMQLDAFGGPDAAHDSFTPVQKAISYAMTSVLTTGGIRGNKKHIGQFHPRSFNMGLSRKVYEHVGGFILTRLGEDIEYSIRIHRNGFKIGLIPDAKVYHKRRTSLFQFYKQLHFFGRARINIYKHFPSELKLVHFFPAGFTIGLALLVVFNLLNWPIAKLGNIILLVYLVLLFLDALRQSRSLKIAALGTVAACIQLLAYGLGFLQDFTKRVLFKLS